MVSGYDKHGPEFTPRGRRRTVREWLLLLTTLAAGVAVGATLGWYFIG